MRACNILRVCKRSQTRSEWVKEEEVKSYFAGPLFSEAEREWIRATIQKIESLAAQRGTKVEIICIRSPECHLTMEGSSSCLKNAVMR